MDYELIYAVLGIIVFIIIIYFTLRQNEPQIVKTKDEKRAEIISKYKEELKETLEVFQNDNKNKIAKKTLLLKQFSAELSRNIFFDNDEIREIIQELSQEH